MEMPDTLGARGRRLWASLTDQHPGMTEPEFEIAVEACRTADRLEALDEICRTVEPVLTTEKGNVITHPAYAEARQQGAALKLLIVALRLPDEKTGARPQRRSARGVESPKGTVSSLARARAARGA